MTNGDAVRVRPPAVAGQFYPEGRDALLDAVRASFAGAVAPDDELPAPKALVVPHAGYVYSGPIAASAYLRLASARAQVRRVVLLGPSHRVPVDGVALSGADAFLTPLGPVPVDRAGRELALSRPGTYLDDAAHASEHSLEVQLPFLQVVLDSFEVLPMAVGRSSPDDVAELLGALWGGAETVVVVSTDLSHYRPYDEARARDERTAAAVRARRPQEVGDRDACGAAALRGLLAAAGPRGMHVEQLDLRNSGDTAGDRERVVGYGAFALH